MKKILLLGLVGLSLGCAHYRHHDGEKCEHGAGMKCEKKCEEKCDQMGEKCEHKADGKCEHMLQHKGEGKAGCAATLEGSKGLKAAADVRPLAKGKISGAVKLAQDGKDVKIFVQLKGFKANAVQGFHIHQYGDCSAADGSSAGGHYNPYDKPHAGPSDAARHVGDLGNLTADKTGAVAAELTVANVQLAELVGRSLVVHAKADDLKTQPAGGAGDRVSCGVIGLAQ